MNPPAKFVHRVVSGQSAGGATQVIRVGQARMVQQPATATQNMSLVDSYVLPASGSSSSSATQRQFIRVGRPPNQTRQPLVVAGGAVPTYSGRGRPRLLQRTVTRGYRPPQYRPRQPPADRVKVITTSGAAVSHPGGNIVRLAAASPSQQVNNVQTMNNQQPDQQ